MKSEEIAEIKGEFHHKLMDLRYDLGGSVADMVEDFLASVLCKHEDNPFPRCPKCGEAKDVEGGRFQADGNTAWQPITCNKCGCEYTEIYRYDSTEIQA